MATFLLTSLPFAAALAGGTLRRRSRRSQLVLWLGALFIGLVIVSLGVVRSRAGLALAGPALALSFLVAWVAAGRGRPQMGVLALVAATGIAVVAVALFALGPIMARFDSGGAPEARFELWPDVASAADTYLPLGSGLGSFNAVYRSVEPLERLDPTLSNQAHNEYLETWLEAGWLGAALIILFVVWWARRTWASWRSPPSRDGDLRRAASVAILMVMLHSLVDYPLRTSAMIVLFALFSAILEGSNAGDLADDPSPRSTGRA